MIKQEQMGDDSPKTTKKQPRRYLRTPNQQGQSIQNPYSILHSANPILPPDVHKDYHQVHPLKFRTTLQKSKLNKTTFPQVKARNWLNQTQSGMNMNKNNDSIIFQDDNEDCFQFKELIMNKILVYCRINNRKYNKIDKDQPLGFYCSIFINSRKQSIKSKKIPIFQYMPRIYKDIKPYTYPEDILSFNSAYQSGNLFCAYKCPMEPMLTYQLYMQNDINTKGCTQWFYFSICAQKRVKIKLKIMNFYKPTSLYMNGMKILVSIDQVQWKRVGTSIRYSRVGLENGKQSYALEFMYEIEQFQKQHYFCYGYPYSLTHLENVLNKFSELPLFTRIALKSNLCQTFLGNNVPILTISNHLKQKMQKPIIYIIARQHPGETPGSHIVEGLIRAILSNKIQMDELRENFIIKIVPMINVDGVINGNYRSNFSGNDVNRQWHQPSRRLHPEILTLKQEIINNKKNVHFFLDIHAHSRKMNSFFYGSKSFNYDNRLYPFVCSKLNKNISFYQSSFADDPSKKTTARVVLQNEANIKKSLTFQASFYGYEDEHKKIKTHFKQQDLKGLGQSLALGLYYSEIGSPKYTSLLNQTIQLDKSRKQLLQNAKNTVSCQLGKEQKKTKKSQNYLKIQKNCQRIMEKWKRQLQKMNKQDQDFVSEGSSLNPEHFQLTQIQEQRLMNNINNHIKQKLKHSPEQSISKTMQVLVIQQKRQNEDQINFIQKQQKTVQQSKNKQQPMKFTFFPMQSNLRNSMVVKKLQSQLQMQKTHRRYQSFRSNRQRQLSESKKDRLENQIIRGKKFKSIDIQVKEPSNYKNNIIEIKKALKYFMENKAYDYKSTDYDDYKAYLKYSTNGKTLVFSDKDSIARLKRKYTRI